MPNSQRKGFKAKAGGAGQRVATQERSAVTGKKVGKRAAASNAKNMMAADEYIEAVEKQADLDNLFRVKTLARVMRHQGAGRILVTLQDGSEVETVIAGRLRFHGRAATKTDRPVCMVMNSVVLLDGGHAVSNLSMSHIARIQLAYQAADIKVTKGFFTGSVGSDCEGFEWDLGASCPLVTEPSVKPVKHEKLPAEDDLLDVDMI
jgi:hypothetical protein